MNLTLNVNQTRFLAELLVPHRNSSDRQTRRLVEKVDKLMEEVREVDAHYKAFKKAHEGSPTCMTCFWFCYTRDGAQCAAGVVDKPSPAQTACQYYRINKFP